MTLSTKQSIQTLYTQDYYLWLQATIDQLKMGQVSALDLDNLIEELESMGRSEKRALKNLLTRLLEHCLKLIYWESERDYNANKWKSEITAFRGQIKDLMEDSPSLKPYLVEVKQDCGWQATKTISYLIGKEIPNTKIATLEQILDDDWFPDI